MISVLLPFPPSELNPNKMKGRHWTAEEDEFLAKNWKSLSHAQMGLALNRSQKGVRNRCWRLGLVSDGGEWADWEVELLASTYQAAECGAGIKLDDLAESLGRLKSNICRKARALGLTEQGRPKKLPEERRMRKPMFLSDDARAQYRSTRMREYIQINGHPKGMLGKTHTEAIKAQIGEKSKTFNAGLTEEQRAAMNLKAMRTKVARGTYAPERQKTTWKAGWREIGGKRKYYRSRWEANYARYLQWLKEKGRIADWAHEPTTFWFEGIKRGTCSYLPDFLVMELGGAQVYYEVKGWMDDRSKTKIRRMAKYHPTVKLIVIQEKQYMAVAKAVGSLIEGWE